MVSRTLVFGLNRIFTAAGRIGGRESMIGPRPEGRNIMTVVQEAHADCCKARVRVGSCAKARQNGLVRVVTSDLSESWRVASAPRASEFVKEHTHRVCVEGRKRQRVQICFLQCCLFRCIVCVPGCVVMCCTEVCTLGAC